LSPSLHRPHVEALGIDPDAAGALAIYLDLLADWDRRINLTGVRSPAARVEVLVEAILPALPLLDPGPLLDVGSGNGSPGLVLSLLRPGERGILLEPRGKRWAFLREAARAVGRPDLEILRVRHDQYRGSAAPNVTLRALALPLPELAALVAPGGRLLVFGSCPQSAEGWTRDAGIPPGGIHSFRRECFT
jgi:16S rRNA (guanine527-N7)-methyltransferase